MGVHYIQTSEILRQAFGLDLGEFGRIWVGKTSEKRDALGRFWTGSSIEMGVIYVRFG